MEDCLDLESDPSLVVATRAFVRARLEAWEAAELTSDAELIASELVTNAVLHARTAIQLRLSVEESRVRIEVYDENTRAPALPSCGPDATSGRGLALVSSLANSWGIEHQGDGKVVWAEIGAPREEPSEDCLDLSGANNVEQALEKVDGSSRARLDR